MVHEQLPSFTTLERSLAKRKTNQIYIDYLQNSRGQTLASAYSARPKPGATVSTPLEWKEVKPGLQPCSSLKEHKEKSGKERRSFEGVLGKGINIPLALKKWTWQKSVVDNFRKSVKKTPGKGRGHVRASGTM